MSAVKQEKTESLRAVADAADNLTKTLEAIHLAALMVPVLRSQGTSASPKN